VAGAGAEDRTDDPVEFGNDGGHGLLPGTEQGS
jgi:hypothetical protein